MERPVRFTDESIMRLRQVLYGTPDADPTPFRVHPKPGGRTPILVRCTSATAAGGVELGGTVTYPAKVVDINSLVSDQDEAADVWLSLLDGGTTASPLTYATPVSGNCYYGLYAGTFDPFPSGASDPRPKVYAVTRATSGSTPTVSAWKEPVRVATTVAGTLASSFENGDSIDGVTLATGDRILIKDQASATENGIYTVNASGAPTRATDADTGAELLGAVTFVSEGTANRDTVWGQTTNATISVGVSNIVWGRVSPAGITVQDIDAVPSYASTITLRFDQADGFTLSQPSANVARVDMETATTTQVGIVSTSAQSFAGDKTFIASVIAGGDLSSFANDTCITQIEGGSVGHASIDATWPFGNCIVLYMKDTTHITSSGSGQESITVRMLHVNTLAHGLNAGEYFGLSGSNSRNAYFLAQGYAVTDALGVAYASGVSGSFTAGVKTVTVNNGIITGIV